MPMRTCVGCRQVSPQATLVRFVVRGAQVCPDQSGTAAGRGAYLHDDPACLALAQRRGAFARSFRRRVDSSGLVATSDSRLGETGQSR